jgi:hypothetical protein
MTSCTTANTPCKELRSCEEEGGATTLLLYTAAEWRD